MCVTPRNSANSLGSLRFARFWEMALGYCGPFAPDDVRLRYRQSEAKQVVGAMALCVSGSGLTQTAIAKLIQLLTKQ